MGATGVRSGSSGATPAGRGSTAPARAGCKRAASERGELELEADRFEPATCGALDCGRSFTRRKAPTPRLYCNDACRQRAAWARARDGEPAEPRVLVERLAPILETWAIRNPGMDRFLTTADARKLRMITARAQRTVTLGVADRLLIATGNEGRLHEVLD